MEENMVMTPTSVSFSPNVYNRIREAAKREHRSVSNWIEATIIASLDEMPNEVTAAAIDEVRNTPNDRKELFGSVEEIMCELMK
ncbi:MAG: hypothetical protein ACI3Y0_05475 [Prevotella sp.]